MSLLLFPPSARRPVHYAILLLNGLLIGWCVYRLINAHPNSGRTSDFLYYLEALLLLPPGLAAAVFCAARLWPSRWLRWPAIGLLVLVAVESVLLFISMVQLASPTKEDNLIVGALIFLVPPVVFFGCFYLIYRLQRPRRATPPAQPAEPAAME